MCVCVYIVGEEQQSVKDFNLPRNLDNFLFSLVFNVQRRSSKDF